MLQIWTKSYIFFTGLLLREVLVMPAQMSMSRDLQQTNLYKRFGKALTLTAMAKKAISLLLLKSIARSKSKPSQGAVTTNTIYGDGSPKRNGQSSHRV